MLGFPFDIWVKSCSDVRNRSENRQEDKMSKIPISVCMIAKNEEKYIEECLRHLKPYGFEIVVTDTGSADRTREIAEKYADKVLDFAWVNDFSAARNFCVANASHNWILSLDCDEYVCKADVEELQRLMKKYPRYVGSIRLRNVSYANGKKEFTTDDVIRFYDRRYYRFVLPVHEQITYMEDDRIGDSVTNFMLPMDVEHYGYAVSEEERIRKNERNLALLYDVIDKNPDDPYMHFQAAQSERVLGNNDKAIVLYERSLELNQNVEYPYVGIGIQMLAKLYMHVGRGSEALALMEQYAQVCRSAKFTYTHAQVFYDSGNPLKALVLFLKTSILPDADTLGDELLQCYRYIINIYNDMGNAEMVWAFREKYEQCIIERNKALNSER